MCHHPTAVGTPSKYKQERLQLGHTSARDQVTLRSIAFIHLTSRGFSAHPLGWLVSSRSHYFVISLFWMARGFSEWP